MGFLSMHKLNIMCCVHYVVKYSKSMVDQISAIPGLGLMEPHYYIMCCGLYYIQTDYLLSFVRNKLAIQRFYLKYNIIK